MLLCRNSKQVTPPQCSARQTLGPSRQAEKEKEKEKLKFSKRADYPLVPKIKTKFVTIKNLFCVD
jgi:hypothetical protein